MSVIILSVLCNLFWLTADLQQVVLINLPYHSKVVKSNVMNYLQQLFDPDLTKGAWVV